MGSVGDAYDNALGESFFATLECELLDRRRFPTQAEARMAVFDFIEGWYNPHRRHSGLAYHSPISYEQRHPVVAQCESRAPSTKPGQLQHPRRASAKRRAGWSRGIARRSFEAGRRQAGRVPSIMWHVITIGPAESDPMAFDTKSADILAGRFARPDRGE